MKKAGSSIFILLLLGLTVAFIVFGPESDVRKPSNTAGKSTITINKDHIYTGHLLLINHDHPVRKSGMMKDIIHLSENTFVSKGYGLLRSDIRLSEHVANEFSKMVKDAEKEGIDQFMVNSGFRTFEEQNRLYLEMGADYAMPEGYSEHNAGFALDIGSSEMKMEKAPEGKWLEKNAWKYGFILRYPKDKSAITGIQYEPWHFPICRFAAQRCHPSGRLCLGTIPGVC
ncbi:M15 family metallopeptidase [Siminovitchia sp. FSL H7-0308]|uniref:M15 family metallopeptidase n=1 Tax=Siminovitchia sp. FSL H7-0308 TaxID=2921432 RepID=UPI0030EC41BA